MQQPPLATAPDRPPAGFSRPVAWGLTAALAVVCLAAVVALVERPLLTRPQRAGRERRAAFAIRDYVLPFQQWGTRSFTVPTLEAGYGKVEYVTMRRWGEDRSDEVAARLSQLLATHDVVDLFLLAHSNPFVRWVNKVPAEARRKLRLVYNTGCFDLRQKDEWMALGAKAYVGHVGSSESPVFYVYFLRRWLRGLRLDDVMAESNARTAAFLRLGLEGGLSNPQATIAATHAERTGDGGLTIHGGLR